MAGRLLVENCSAFLLDLYQIVLTIDVKDAILVKIGDTDED
jgi:hypothetical protein